MRKALKWILIALGGLVGLVALAVAGLLVYGSVSFKQVHKDRPLYPISADTSPEGLRRGKYLMENVMKCTEACHSPEGKPLQGVYEEFSQGPISAVFAPSNLTPDVETGLGGWTDAEIARAIREGVDKDGVELVIMPSYSYHVLSDADVAAIVGYLRNLQPVHNEIPPFQANSIAKAMWAMGMLGPRSLGDPIMTKQETPPAGTVEYGRYMVAVGACRDCHGENLAGGPLPFAEPGSPGAANLTPGGELVGWSEADFIQAVREGVKPSGKTLSEEMPRYQMTDEDLATIYQYLKELPAAQPKK